MRDENHGSARDRWPTGRTALAVLGVVLLVAWLVWWVGSVRADRLRGGRLTWLPVLSRLGHDFYGNYWNARSWLNGGKPYVAKQPFVRSSVPYLYPPACLWQFTWCGLPLGPRQAEAVWLAAAGVIIALAVFVALRGRRDLGLWLPPWPFALALVLCSSPVLFELERANCNVLVLLHLLLGIAALRGRSLTGDAAAGLVLGLAFWTKIYPLLLIGGLLPLRRWRAFACAVAATGLMAVLDLQGLAGFLRNNAVALKIHSPGLNGSYPLYSHALGAWWMLLWRGTGWDRVGQVPELLSATCLLLPLVALVSRAVFRVPGEMRGRLALPFLLWLTGTATFFSPMAYDYNLLFLPLAALATWDRRDPVVVPLLMGLALLWLQPLRLPIDPFLMTGFKLACVLALGISLLERCREVACASGAPDGLRPAVSPVQTVAA